MKRSLSILILLALVSTSYADLEFASGAGAPLIVSDSGTALTFAGVDALAGPADGVYLITFGNTIDDRYTVSVAFAPGADNTAFSIFTGHYTANVNLTNIAWTGGTSPGSQAFNVSLVSAASDGLFVENPISGLTWSTDFSSITLEFTTQAGSGDNTTFTLDAISNAAVVSPEPGTFALFAIGAVGLAGLVRRRSAHR